MYHSKFTVGSAYARSDIAEIVEDRRIAQWQQGLYYLPGTTLLFVTLDKTGMVEAYNDWFAGEYFHWDTQTKQSRESAEIRAMQEKRVEVLLFCRLSQSRSGTTCPHVYCGRLKWINAVGDNPASVTFKALDVVEGARGPLAEIYTWEPKDSEGSSLPLASAVARLGQGGSNGEQSSNENR